MSACTAYASQEVDLFRVNGERLAFGVRRVWRLAFGACIWR